MTLIFAVRNFFKERRTRALQEKEKKLEILEAKAREEIPDEPVSKVTRTILRDEEPPRLLSRIEIKARMFDTTEKRARADNDHEPVSNSITQKMKIITMSPRSNDDQNSRPNQV